MNKKIDEKICWKFCFRFWLSTTFVFVLHEHVQEWVSVCGCTIIIGQECDFEDKKGAQ